MCLTDIMRRTNMKYTPSINIAQTTFNPAGYIVTQNALGVIGNIVDSFNAGVHLEKHQATSERYQEIKDRLKTKNEKLSRLKSLILVNYNAGLLDNF